jgi:hypothetical protein
MKPPTERHAGPEIIDLLADIIGCSPDKAHLRSIPKEFDYSISLPGQRFLVEYKSSASAGRLASAVEQLKRLAEANRERGLPLLVVPFMGQVGQEICERSGVSWLDLSGNAMIVAPGLRIRIEGRPNKFTDRGRPPNLFAPKSSRIARHLLLQPQRFQTQAEIVRQTKLDDGYVSKIVRRLEQEHFLDVNDNGAVRPRNPNLLLDAWRSIYDFNHHRVIKGHVAARSGDDLVQRIAAQCSHKKLKYAATGLSAAWLYTSFTAFRIATFYLAAMPPRSLLKDIEFSDEPKGANLWLAIPDDEGVFQGTQQQAGVPCVSAIQTYLDLKDHPERAREAATELRRKLLDWGRHGA